MKRVFDILFALIVLICFLPIGMVLSLCIAFESRGGVFFSQNRVGKDGVSFQLLKFRSMHVNAESQGRITVGSRDSRITKSGYYLRKYKLDEFPQFINVLKGEMSIVGPRPEVQEYVDLYTESQRKILQVKPGITDLASLAYFHENELLAKSDNPQQTYIQEVMLQNICKNLSRLISKENLCYTCYNIVILQYNNIVSDGNDEKRKF
jgi:lipopolysaccharide/colanic/teichoic acid biosynthesis glycosyltransferase